MRDDFMTSKFTRFMNPNQKLEEYKKTNSTNFTDPNHHDNQRC